MMISLRNLIIGHMIFPTNSPSRNTVLAGKNLIKADTNECPKASNRQLSLLLNPTAI
jgi:hypothetical protein